MRALLVIPGIVVLALLAGCGGGTSAGGDGSSCPAGTTLTLAPKPQAVAAGGSAVTFYANLTGCQEMVVWSLAGPGRLSANQGTPVVYAPPPTLASPTPATVTITAGGLADSVTFTVNP